MAQTLSAAYPPNAPLFRVLVYMTITNDLLSDDLSCLRRTLYIEAFSQFL